MKISKTNLLFLMILFLGIFLRVRLSTDRGLHKWDERFHALVAKNMLEDPFKPVLNKLPALPYDYKQWYANHVWVHKPPLPLWLIAASLKVFGISEFAVRIPSILLSSLAIYLTFFLGKKLNNESTGLLAALFCSISGILIEMASGRITTDHYDTIFLTMVLTGITFGYLDSISLRRALNILTGIFLGLALLTKWLPALIILPVYFMFLHKSRLATHRIFLRTASAFIIGVMVALPWQLYIKSAFPEETAWESHYNWLHFTRELEGHDDKEGLLYYLHMWRINYSEIIYLPLALLLYRTLRHRNNFQLWALSIWIFVPVLIFSFAKTKLQGYILFTAPALFIITSDFILNLVKRYREKKGQRVVRLLTGILILLSLILPVRYCFERTAFGLDSPRENSWTAAYKSLRGKVPENAVVFRVNEAFEFLFYNGGAAYKNKEVDVETLETLQSKGFDVYFLNEDQDTLIPY